VKKMQQRREEKIYNEILEIYEETSAENLSQKKRKTYLETHPAYQYII